MTVKFRVRQRDVVREFEFDRDTVTIGRGPLNDVVLDEEGIARKHGVLALDAQGRLKWTCGSRTASTSLHRAGVEFDSTDGDVDQQWELQRGDEVRLGSEPEPAAQIEILSSDVVVGPKPSFVEFVDKPPAPRVAARIAQLAAGLARDPSPALVLGTLHELLEDRGVSPGSSDLVVFSGADEFHNDVWGLDESGDCRSVPDPSQLLGPSGPLISARWKSSHCIAIVGDMALIPIGPERLDAVIVHQRAELTADAAQHLAAVATLIRPYGELFVERHRMAHAQRALVEENRYFRARQREHYLYKELVCESDAMKEVHHRLHLLRDDDRPVLIAGEAGTGKALLARLLHHSGSRSGQMILGVKCTEYADESANFELFGSSSSDDDSCGPQQGVFELAGTGTVFLEELDLLPPLVQAKLCRTLKEGEVRRVGESVGRPVRARLVASVHRDLAESVAEGRLRRDLYLLLRDQTLVVPPLRERREDILPLARNFLAVYAVRYGRQADGFTPQAEERLMSHPWPGNVRELQARIEAAILGTQKRRVDAPSLGLR